MMLNLVLSELMSYIEEYREDETLPVFKLSDLGKMYNARLKEIDPTFSGKTNTTRLKERLQTLIPDLRAQPQGREVVLMFNTDMGKAIKYACAHSADEEAMDLMWAAKILRRDILAQDYSFDGHFEAGCEKKCCPKESPCFG